MPFFAAHCVVHRLTVPLSLTIIQKVTLPIHDIMSKIDCAFHPSLEIVNVVLSFVDMDKQF